MEILVNGISIETKGIWKVTPILTKRWDGYSDFSFEIVMISVAGLERGVHSFSATGSEAKAKKKLSNFRDRIIKQWEKDTHDLKQINS